MYWLIGGIGVVVLYIGWYISLTSWSRLRELGLENKNNSGTYFDTFLKFFGLGILVGRIIWMIMNAGTFSEVPWSIFPYARVVSTIDWFTFFPWRVLRITEGVYMPALWGVFGLFSALSIYLPTVRLARRLRLEKRGIMRSFLLRNAVGFALTVSYTGLLVWFSLS